MVVMAWQVVVIRLDRSVSCIVYLPTKELTPASDVCLLQLSILLGEAFTAHFPKQMHYYVYTGDRSRCPVCPEQLCLLGFFSRAAFT